MQKISLVRKSAWAVAAVMGLSLTGSAFGDVSIGIRIGEPAPPPRPVVTTTVVSYETYCVGPRRMLYDADWRLRTAQCDEIRAQEELEAARRHEGEIAVAMEEQEARVAELKRCVGGAAANAAEARIRLTALEKRIASARSDLDSARVLRDGPGMADAERRLRENEAAAAATVEEIKRAEAAAAAREQLAAAEAQLGRIRADFEVAHDAVFACQNRLTDAHERVCLALHDRDNALWVMYRDDIVFGRIRPETVGFRIDLTAFGGRMPRDPELVRVHCVRDVTYWRTRPVEIQTRVVEVDRCTEVVKIREYQRVREPHFQTVAAVEVRYTPEVRIQIAERVSVERTRFEAARTERTVAAKEGRKPQVSEVERAEAKAIVMKAQAEAKATKMTAAADAKATVIDAKSDAKAQKMAAAADAKTKEAEAKATVIDAKSDAKAQKMTAAADAKATKETAHADAKSKEIAAHANAKSQVAEARGDAKANVIEARGDTKSKIAEAKGDAKANVIDARGDTKSKIAEAKGDAKAKEAQAHGEAKSSVIAARGDTKSQIAEAKGDAKAKEIQAHGDAKSQVTQARGDAKSKEIAAKTDAKSRDPRVETKAPARQDPRDARQVGNSRASVDRYPADQRGNDPKSSKDAKNKNGKKDPRDPNAPL